MKKKTRKERNNEMYGKKSSRRRVKRIFTIYQNKIKKKNNNKLSGQRKKILEYARERRTKNVTNYLKERGLIKL